jgi:site-specific recombinase XerD
MIRGVTLSRADVNGFQDDPVALSAQLDAGQRPATGVDSFSPVPTAASKSAALNPAGTLGVRFLRPISENTALAYSSDWGAFEAWCADHDLPALPASGETVAEYLRSRANAAPSGDMDEVDGGVTREGYAVSTLQRWASTISVIHRKAGHPSPGATPAVQSMLASARHLSSRPPRVMKAVTLADLLRALRLINMTSNPAGILGHRDWAILVMGFAGAFQRSELAALTFSDIHPGDQTGIRLRIRTAKATRTGRGVYKLLPYGQSAESCPACALFRWTRILATAQDRERFDLERVLAKAAVTDHLCQEDQPQIRAFDPQAPVLRPILKGGHIQAHKMSGDVVNDVVKRRLAAAGMDPTSIGAHSLRAGFVREALRGGHAPTAVMLQTDHANALSIEKYRRDDEPSGRNPVLDMGF